MTNRLKTVLDVDYAPLDFYRSTAIPPNDWTHEEYKAAMVRDGLTEREAQLAIDRMLDPKDEIWLSDAYQVSITPLESTDPNAPPMKWLSIKRRDRKPIHDWRDLQVIKNKLIGPECEAFELYPAESRCVDEANQFHLWAFTDPQFRVPLGFNERSVGESSVAGSVQRPFTPEHKGTDITRSMMLEAIEFLLPHFKHDGGDECTVGIAKVRAIVKALRSRKE